MFSVIFKAITFSIKYMEALAKEVVILALPGFACFQMKFQVPLAALIRHLSFDEQCRFSIRKRQDRLPAIHLPL